MGAQTVSQTIQFILAPAVMITACAIILGGLSGRLASINDRLRAFSRERFELIRSGAADRYSSDRIDQIDKQLPDLLHRLRMEHNAVTLIYSALFIYIMTMLVIALAAQTNNNLISLIALLLFLAATLVLASGLLVAIREIRISLVSIMYEVESVSMLKREAPNVEEKAQLSQQM